MRIGKSVLVSLVALCLLGVLVPVISLKTCQKFEPEGFLSFTTDSAQVLGGDNYVLHGTIKNIGDYGIIDHGFCWSEQSEPTTSGSATHLESRDTRGSFSSTISGLSSNKLYYYRAYVTTDKWTEYAIEKSFFTGESLATVTDIDGNVYATVQIGDQIWMAENMKTSRYHDGTAIPLVESETEWKNLPDPAKAYCWYDNSSSNEDTFGALYTYAAAMNDAGSSDTNPSGIQGVCPDGWHIPSDTEWKELEIYLGMTQLEADGTAWRGSDEGGALKDTSSLWNDPNLGASNESGFSGLPGGYRRADGVFTFLGSYAVFWTTTAYSATEAWHRNLLNSYEQVYRFSYEKNGGFSVRCLKD